jgi:3',5'-cyclic-AMP phosphodiesterase
MIIAQISDTHIKSPGKLAYGVVDTTAMLKRALAELNRLRPLPDIVVVTGDLVDFGRADEYQALKELLAPLTMPLYLLCGNHDDAATLRQVFSETQFDYLRIDAKFLQYEIDLGDLRLLALDTTVPGQSDGLLCADRLAWLEQRLSQDSRPVVIAMHHPPFSSGIAHMDRIGLSGIAGLHEVIIRYPQVERIICGHLHRSIVARFAGTVASTCSSPAHQVVLDLDSEGPDAFVMEPPGFQLHLWANGKLISHHAVIGDFPGPYAFREGGKLIDDQS